MFLGIMGAIVCYLEWSSEAAWVEFGAANKSSLSNAGRRPEIRNQVQIVGQTPCVADDLRKIHPGFLNF